MAPPAGFESPTFAIGDQCTKRFATQTLQRNSPPIIIFLKPTMLERKKKILLL